MKHRHLLMTALTAFSITSALAAEKAPWSYEGTASPKHWGELKPEYAQCKTGVSQSPINISSAVHAQLAPLDIAINKSPMRVINNAHTIQVNTKNASTLKIDNNVFSLLQLHFHTPSENTIDGKHFPLEGHLVYRSDNDELAVVGVMYESGAANPELEKIWNDIPTQINLEADIKQAVDLKGLLPKDLSYYRFTGSLTTPPCSEGVRWLVLKTPLTISDQQLGEFTKAIPHPNNRPVQPLHGRVIVQ